MRPTHDRSRARRSVAPRRRRPSAWRSSGRSPISASRRPNMRCSRRSPRRPASATPRSPALERLTPQTTSLVIANLERKRAVLRRAHERHGRIRRAEATELGATLCWRRVASGCSGHHRRLAAALPRKAASASKPGSAGSPSMRGLTSTRGIAQTAADRTCARARSRQGRQGSAMNVLILGAGGREHALALALAKSPALTRLFVAPGNPGCAAVAENVALAIDDHARSSISVARATIGLVVVGPEAPLVAGVADDLAAAGDPVLRAEQGGGARSKARRASPRTSAASSAFRPATIAASPTPPPRWPMSAPRARRSSSRPTAWPRARASSSP